MKNIIFLLAFLHIPCVCATDIHHLTASTQKTAAFNSVFSNQHDTTTFTFKGNLIEKTPLPAYCGTIAWAVACKFHIINTNAPVASETILLIIPCPREYGEEFYQTTGYYTATIATGWGTGCSWTVINAYEQENLPTYWTRKINYVPDIPLH